LGLRWPTSISISLSPRFVTRCSVTPGRSSHSAWGPKTPGTFLGSSTVASRLAISSTLKTGISARNLQIGIADSRKRHSHDGFAIADRLCHISALQFAILVTQGLHKTRGRKSEVRGRSEGRIMFTSDLRSLTSDLCPLKLLRFLIGIFGCEFYSLSLAANVDRQSPLETFAIRHVRRGADPPIPWG